MSATRCARAVVAALLELGVEHVVLCPGSRSAPLAFAWQAAAREGGVELHVRIDERSAGFLALGLAKASGQVVPIVTTSGTAVGNLLPAVMEAAHTGVPLLVSSADRPATLTHTGATQTTEQAGIFGGFVRASAVLSGAEGSPAAWAYQIGRLVAAARGDRTGDPGPVQLNLAFAEPLMPADEEWPDVSLTRVVTRAPGDMPVELASDRRTVVLVGDCTPEVGDRARLFAEHARVPLLSEPSGNARVAGAVRTYRVLLDGELGRRIERVVLFGHPTLSRPVTRLLARAELELVVVATGAQWVDPGLNADVVADAVTCGVGDPSWLAEWTEADQAVSAGLDRLLGAELSGLTIARVVWESLGVADSLVIGSSHPIRDLDLAPIGQRMPRVYANRGLSGIDGTVATAAGIALVNGPTTLLLGDLTLLHDVGGLLVGPLERRPLLRIVVVNDDGGSIFHILEQGADEHADSFERVFGTPTGVAIEPLAAAYGWDYQQVGTLAELRELLARPIAGREIVEVRVSRAGRRELAARIADLHL